MGTTRGPSGVRAALEPFFTPVLEQTFVVKREVVNGPVVFLERFDRHLMPTGWIELPVTGVYEVHDGRITLCTSTSISPRFGIRWARRRTDAYAPRGVRMLVLSLRAKGDRSARTGKECV